MTDEAAGMLAVAQYLARSNPLPRSGRRRTSPTPRPSSSSCAPPRWKCSCPATVNSDQGLNRAS